MFFVNLFPKHGSKPLPLSSYGSWPFMLLEMVRVAGVEAIKMTRHGHCRLNFNLVHFLWEK